MVSAKGYVAQRLAPTRRQEGETRRKFGAEVSPTLEGLDLRFEPAIMKVV